MSLVKSKQRVADHGEVFTPAWMFGIGITQITSLLARRSVYCSKHATVPIRSN